VATLPPPAPPADRSDPLRQRTEAERERHRLGAWLIQHHKVRIVGTQPEPDPEPMPLATPEAPPTRRDMRLEWVYEHVPGGRRR
jgi:hypothetical protein